jgi:hypothetical protein
MCSQKNNIIRVFSNAFWAGKRWVSFPSNCSVIHLKRIRFYVSFQGASAFCKNYSKQGIEYRFKALANVLKVNKICDGNQDVNIFLSPASKIEVPFPITSYNSPDRLDQLLLSGDYIPVNWNKREYDPFEISVQQFGTVVRYDLVKKKIQFYDGKIKKARPGQNTSLGDLAYFDFKRLSGIRFLEKLNCTYETR